MRDVGEFRIIKQPTGEAPPQVRKAWIGITFYGARSKGIRGRGVLTGRPLPVREEVVRVSQSAALDQLASQHPEAADWWRAHGYPKRGLKFLFGIDEVEQIA